MQLSDASLTYPQTESQYAKLPVHVLMLPLGSHAFQVNHRKPTNSNTTQPQDGCDLIDQRWLHRERKSHRVSSKNLDVSFYTSDDIGKDGSVWIGASTLEIAMINCCTCDEPAYEEQDPQVSGKEMVMKSRTRLKRTRDEEDDYLPSDEEEDRKLVAKVHKVIQTRPKFVRGSLKRGREMNFLSLMARFCNTTSDRSLALAILARTVLSDKDEEIVHKNREFLHQRCKQGLSPSEIYADKGNNITEDSVTRIKESDILHSVSSSTEGVKDQTSSVEYASPGKQQIPIITTFLISGGMRVLKQWLQEAFTPIVSKAPRLTEAVSTLSSKAPSTVAATALITSTNSNPKKRSVSATSNATKVSLLPSRTCALLPIILKLLQDMPFHKTLVYETQINKQIRKLKKLLEKTDLKYQTDSNGMTSSERIGEAKFGPLSVAQLLKAVESLMDTWKEALAVSNKAGGPETYEVSAPDAFNLLRQGLRERFKASFPNIQLAELSTPHVIPKASKTSISVVENKVEKTSNISISQKSSANKIQTREEELKAMQARLDAQRKIMELYLQKMAETNHKMAEELSERKHDSFSSTGRRVTWADTSRKGTLVEIREYIVDSLDHENISHDFASEIREEHNEMERRRLLLQSDRPKMMHILEYDDDETFS